MKKFNKVLALVLATIMLLTTLPLSVFAAGSGVSVDTTTNESTNNGVVVTDSTITVKVDPAAFADLVESEGISADLIAAFLENTSVDVEELLDFFSLDEVFELIPEDDWKDNFDVDKILDDFGGVEGLEENGLDTEALFNEVEDYIADIANDSEKNATFNDLLADSKYFPQGTDRIIEIIKDNAIADLTNRLANGVSKSDLEAKYMYSENAVLESIDYDVTIDPVKGVVDVVASVEVVDDDALCFSVAWDEGWVPSLDELENDNLLDKNELGIYFVKEGIIDAETIADAIDVKALVEYIVIDQGADVAHYVGKFFVLVGAAILENFDKVEINGELIAVKSEETKSLQVDVVGLFKLFLTTFLPLNKYTADDWDGTLGSTSVAFDYTAVNDASIQRSKKVTLKFVLESGKDEFQSVIREITNFFSNPYINEIYFNGTEFVVDVNAHPVVAELLKQAINSDELEEGLKQTLAQIAEDDNFYNAVANELTFENLDKVVNVLDAEAIYAVAREFGYYKRMLNAYDALTGFNLSNMGLQDLADAFQANEMTLNEFNAAVKEQTGVNLKGAIRAAAEGYDWVLGESKDIDLVNEILDKIEDEFGVDVRVVYDISAEDVLDDIEWAFNEPVIDSVVDAVYAVVMENFEDELDDLYDWAVDTFESYEVTATRVLDFIRDVVAELAENYPNLTFADYYVGNGKFETVKKVTYNVKDMIKTALEAIFDHFDLDKDVIDTVMDYIRGNDTELTSTFAITFPNVYRVQFKNQAGKTLYSAFMPVGADLSIFKNNEETTGYNFIGWVDANGNAVETMPAQDIVVWADGEVPGEPEVDAPKFELTIDAEGNYIFNILGKDYKAGFELALNYVDDYALLAAKTLTINFSGVQFAYLDAAAMDALRAAGNSLVFTYKYDQATDFAGTKFEGVNGEFLTFEIANTDTDALVESFGEGSVAISTPYTASTADRKAFTVKNGVIEVLNTVADNGVATFTTTHFSDFVVTDVYKLTYAANADGVAIGETVEEYYPVDATAVIDLDFGAEYAGYKMTLTFAPDTAYTLADNKVTFVMAENINLTVTLNKIYNIYFYANGTLVNTIAYTAAEVATVKDQFTAAPAGTVWSWNAACEAQLAKSDIVVTAVTVVPTTTYTVVFAGVEATYTVSAASEAEAVAAALAIAPAVPAKEGYAAAWSQAPVVDGATITFSAIYTVKSFNVVFNDTLVVLKDANGNTITSPVAFGSLVKVELLKTDAAYTATIVVTGAALNEDNTFVMPAGDVSIAVVFTPVTSSKVDEKDTTSGQPTYNIYNGDVYTGEGEPEGTKNASFAGWTAAFRHLSFATFEANPASLLWLWILIVVIVLIAAIILLYKLHMAGKIGMNFAVRAAIWCVDIFFIACGAVASFFLMIAGWFGKSNDPADYGFTAEEAVAEEAVAEEAVAEEAVAEEVVAEEAVAEEAVAEEAVAEEAVVEEAVVEEAVVEEAVVEEAVAEEAVVEEAVAEEAVVEEAVAEEAVAEEAVAEEAVAEEAATEEENKEI